MNVWIQACMVPWSTACNVTHALMQSSTTELTNWGKRGMKVKADVEMYCSKVTHRLQLRDKGGELGKCEYMSETT